MFVASIAHLKYTVNHADKPARAAGRGRLRQVPRRRRRARRERVPHPDAPGTGVPVLRGLLGPRGARRPRPHRRASPHRLRHADAGDGRHHLPRGGAGPLPRHLGHHAERGERDQHRGGLPAPRRRGLPAQADLDERAAGAGRPGAGKARPRPPEPVLPGEPRAPGARAGAAGSRSCSSRACRCWPGRWRPRTPTPAATRFGSASTPWPRRRAWASKASRSTGSGWAASCTTSARSAPAKPCCTNPARSRTRSSARSPSTRSSASGCCRRWRRSHPTCCASFARTTSGSTAGDFPTACAARRSRSRPASWRWPMRSTR